MWQYEGEYEQYYYSVEENKITEFLDQAMTYLNTKQIKKEYPWSEPLHGFAKTKKVTIKFGPYNHVRHIEDLYFLRFDYSGGFKLSEFIYTYKYVEYRKGEEK